MAFAGLSNGGNYNTWGLLLLAALGIAHNDDGTLKAFVVATDFSGVDPTGATDSTTGVQNALNSGGTVVFPSGTYLTGNLTIPAKTRLSGSGPGSILKAKAGTTGNYITLASSSTTNNVELESLWIDGTTAGGSLVGIRLDNTGYSGDDVRHRMIDVIVNGFGGDNIQLGTNIRESVFISVSSYNSGGRGFQIESGCTDNKFIACTSGVTLGVGWNIQGNNNLFTSCKAFWAGTSNGTSWTNTIDGWFIGGIGNQQAAILVGCESQDNARHGFVLYNGAFNLNNCILSGCIADSNNAANVSAVGFQLNGATSSSMTGCTAVNRSGGKGTQSYGAQLSGTLTGCSIAGNSLTGATAPYQFSGASGYSIFDNNYVQLQSALQPATPALAGQAGALYMGSGVPSNSNGNNGDVYFRTDTPGTANQRMYIKAGGTWGGIV